MIALGQSQDAGRTCADVKYDGTFLWINGKVAQPQSGYSINNIHVSMNDMNGHNNQRWRIQHTNLYANKQRSRQAIQTADNSWGWETNGFFEIRAYNGQVLYVQGNRVGLRRRSGNANEQFFFDAKTKTIVSKANRGVSLASEEIGKDRYRLVARKTQRTSPELFTRPGRAGLVQLAANKNFVW